MNKNSIENEIKMIITGIKNGRVWYDFDNKTPTYVSDKLIYPHDKAAEIDMYIAKSFGEISQVDALTYEIAMPTIAKEEIALLAFTYGPTLRSPKSETPRETLYQFLVDYNLFHRLRQLCDDFMFLGGGQNHPLRNEGRNIAQTYIENIRNNRALIYSEMIANGVADSRWKREQIAYTIVKDIYNDAIYQYKSEWLGLQSIDIYIPSLKIGIEYQGLQHYLPVDIFGGNSGFQATMERDKLKREKCEANKVTLIEWSYNEPLTTEFIKEKISNYLQ